MNKTTKTPDANQTTSEPPSCPQCQSVNWFWPADYVDNGVGMEKCGPAHCDACGWVEPSFDDFLSSMQNADVDAQIPAPTKPESKTD